MSFDKEAFEEQVIADMREHGGVISSGPMAGTRLLVLTTTGARTGQRRRALLFFSKDGAEYLIAGTASGSTRDPAWLHNLKANPETSVQIGGEHRPVRARVATPAEHERLWPKAVKTYSGYADYQKRTERKIPLVILERR